VLRGALVRASLLLAVFAPVAQANIVVNTQTDEITPGDGQCSLREALGLVNSPGFPSDCSGLAASGTTIINLPAGTYHLNPGDGLLLSGLAGTIDVAIQGPSDNPSQVVIDGGDDSTHRGSVLALISSAQVTLKGLTITGGYSGTGAPGGAGTAGAGESGSPGGGIYTESTLTLDHVAVSANRTGDGGSGGSATSGAGGSGGDGGAGGGIYNTGTLTASDSTISGNIAGAGGSGGFGGPPLNIGGPGGTGGAGAGIASTGMVSLTNTTVTANTAGAGGSSVGFFAGRSGPGGAGGGIDSSGTLVTQSSTISHNAAGPGPARGAGGGGGGIDSTGAGTLALTATTITANTAGNGGDGAGLGANGASGGLGGGILDSGATATLTNDTIAVNVAGSGGAGTTQLGGSNGGNGGAGGGGGGIEYDNPGSMTLLGVTLTQNAVGRPGPGGPATGAGTPGVAGASGAGGAIEAVGMQLTDTSTLIATNSNPACAGTVGDGGYNLDFPAFDTSCPGGHQDPKLGPLSGNGGPTQTVALLAGSGAIDQIPPGPACPATDQRGVARPQPAGGRCDIGAYEYAGPPTCTGVHVATAQARPVPIQLACSDPAGAQVGYALDTGPGHGSLSGLDPRAGTLVYDPAGRYSGVDRFTYHGADGNGTATVQTVTISISPAPSPVAPVIGRLRISPRKFFDTTPRKRGKHRRRTGATISYTDSRAARTTFRLFAPLAGVSTKAGCVKPPRHRPKHARRCTRYMAIAGFSHNDLAGPNRLHFSGVFRHQPLPAASYRLQARPTLGRLVGRVRTISFRILG
jgi:CSLREA domain-containing protein